MFAPETLETWSRLAITTGQSDPFCCTPDWQLPFHEAFAPSRPLLVEAAGSDLIAFAQVPSAEGRQALIPIESHWNFGCPLLGSKAVELLLEKLATRPDVLEVAISGTTPQSSLQHRMVRAFGASWMAWVSDDDVACAASLEGGLDGFLSRRPASLRRNLRSSARRAQQLGVTFERSSPTTPQEVRDAYARILAVELTSWKGRAERGMATGESKVFYELMLQRLARTRAGRVMFARRGDQDLGFIFGGLAGGSYRGQQFSFHDDYRRLGLGNLLQLELLRWLCEEGVQRYDMGPSSGPRMAYKAPWAELRLPLQTLGFTRL